MSIRQYIGARYVPKFMGAFDSTKEYEPLSIVNDGNGNSYTSKIPVPTGSSLSDSTYWVKTASMSGDVQQLENRVGAVEGSTQQLENRVGAVEGSVQQLESEVSSFSDSITLIENEIDKKLKNLYVTPEEFGAVGDGIADDSDAIQAAFNSGLTVVFRNKTYAVGKGVVCGNNTIIGNGATIKAIADIDHILTAYKVDNITIDGTGFDIKTGIMVIANNTNENGYVINSTVKKIYSNVHSANGITVGDTYSKNDVVIYNNHVFDVYSRENGTIGDDSGAATGILIHTSMNVDVIKNVVNKINSTEDGSGIYLSNFHDAIKKNNAIGNTIFDVTTNGIKSHAISAYIIDNTINQNEDSLITKMGYGVRVYGNNSIVKNNHIIFNGSGIANSIFVDLGDNITVDGNILDTPHAHYLICCRGTNHIIRNHNIKTNATGGTGIVYNESTSGGVIEGNAIETSTDVGVYCTPNAACVRNNKIILASITADAIQFGYGGGVSSVCGNITNGRIRFMHTSNYNIVGENTCACVLFNEASNYNNIVNNEIYTSQSDFGVSFSGGGIGNNISGNNINASNVGIACTSTKQTMILNNRIVSAAASININYSTNDIVKNNALPSNGVVSSTGAVNPIIADNVNA